MQVHDAVNTIVVILQGNVVANGTEVVAQVLATGGPGTGKDTAFLLAHRVRHSSL